MKRWRLFWLMIPAFVALSSCFWVHSYEEIERVVSPDSVVEAVLVRERGSATTPSFYLVHIVPAGEDTKAGWEHFKAIHVTGLQLYWRQPKFLEIRYELAKIYNFRNSWASTDIQEGRYVVEVRLVPPTDSWSLSEKDRGIW